jgi:diguanylate cyclase (GGDEF)-like protein/PAS domain S-box-containing protein
MAGGSKTRNHEAIIEPLLAEHLLAGPNGTIICSPSWKITWANDAAHELLGAGGESVVTKSFASWFKKDERFKFENDLRELKCPNGTLVWAMVSISTRENSKIVQLIPANDVGRRYTALSYQEGTLRHAIEAAGHGVWDYNANNEAQFYSVGWKRLRGFPVDQPVDDSLEKWEARLHPEDLEMVREEVRKHNAGEVDEFSFEYRERHTSGHYVWILARGRAVEWDSIGNPTRLIGSDIDITALKKEELRRTEEINSIHQRHVIELENEYKQTEAARKVAHVLSRQDPLTQLPNRRVFSEEIERLLPASGIGKPFAVMLVDLDHFKPVNDLYGHATGDYIIRTAAERLLEVVGPTGTTARLGGDEFGIIFEANEDVLTDLAATCAKRIIATLSESIAIGGFKVDIGASVGIALYPEHGPDAKTLFRNADMALYDIKLSGRGKYKFYSAALGQEAEAKVVLDAATRQAVAQDEFEPYFQPIIDLKSGEIVALEVLARWNSKALGNVSPDKFIGIIDQYNLMPQFTQSMLQQTCVAAKSWPAHVAFSINLTAKEVCDLSTPIRMLDMLVLHSIPCSRFKIEVTEQALMNDLFTAKQVITAFRNAGVHVMLDDFGAGYAGLGYLRELKFDSIKIDRSFVMTLLRQEESAKIVWIMQTLADTLNLKTVAEGIEDQKTLDAIRSIGCNYGQGYHFSRAVPMRDVAQLFAKTPEIRKQA